MIKKWTFWTDPCTAFNISLILMYFTGDKNVARRHRRDQYFLEISGTHVQRNV